MGDAEVARPDRLRLFRPVHFEKFDVRPDPELHHRLRADDRSRKSAHRPLEFGALPWRIFGPKD